MRMFVIKETTLNMVIFEATVRVVIKEAALRKIRRFALTAITTE
jgi:hypothetical protein